MSDDKLTTLDGREVVEGQPANEKLYGYDHQTMKAGINDNLDFKVYQDEKPFIEQAKLDREMGQKKDVGYKKACTIPDIVAVELNYKYGIDIHADTFMHDYQAVRKVIQIIKQDYPYLMSY